MICEILFNVIEKDLERIMRSKGYEFYYPVDNGLKKVDTIIRKEDDGVRNCFFVHPDTSHLIEQYIRSSPVISSHNQLIL